MRSNIIIKNQEDASVNSVENHVKQLEKFLDMGVISESEYHEKLKLLKDYYEKKIKNPYFLCNLMIMFINYF